VDIAQIRALYDQEQRQRLIIPGMRREVDGHLVRHISLAEGGGMVLYSQLAVPEVERAVQAQVAYYQQIGQDFEWKVYSHDSPPDLKDRLQAYGFEIGEEEAILVLDLAAAPAILFEPVTHSLQRVTDPEQIEAVVGVQQQVWQSNFDWLKQRLTTNLRERPNYLSVYIAYVDSVAVASAWTNFPPDNQFASLWGGSTLPVYRRLGIYTALLAARVQEAQRRGIRFLTVDASRMSRPILQKLGFQLIAYAYPCLWSADHSGQHSSS
jgi:GNAT superfamily N-acetyltransferase